MGLSQGRNAGSQRPFSTLSNCHRRCRCSCSCSSLRCISPIPSPPVTTRCHYGHYFLLTVLTSVLVKFVSVRALRIHGKAHQVEVTHGNASGPRYCIIAYCLLFISSLRRCFVGHRTRSRTNIEL